MFVRMFCKSFLPLISVEITGADGRKIASAFIKENTELISAETEMTKIVQAALSGEVPEAENEQLTNLLEMIGESTDDI